MRSRKRQLTWQTGALVLAALVAFAVPVAAKPGSQSKKWTSKASASKHSGREQRFDKPDKLDKDSRSRSGRLLGTSKVIITIKPGQEANAEKEVRKLGGRLGRRLKLVNGMAVELPNRVIKQIAERSEVLSVHFDRPIAGHNSRTAVSVGARAAQQQWGYDGAGIGVAVIDSGISGWHDDLSYSGSSPAVRVVGGQRVTGFVDFVNERLQAYDDNGHGTHVAGIIAGNGYDSDGAHAGIAPAAHLVSLKVLDENGGGVISDVIAAFEWAIANRVALQHPRHQPVGGRAHHRILRNRSADPRGQARRRRRHRRRRRRRQPGTEDGQQQEEDAVRQHHGPGQRALGADGRCLQHTGNTVAVGRQGCAVQLARPRGRRLRGQAGHASRPAPASCRWPTRPASSI